MSRIARTITDKTVGAYQAGSFSEQARGRRWDRFAATFPDHKDMHVLDIGGDARAWRLSGLKPAHVTLLNITAQTVEEDWMTAVVGDACEQIPTSADLVFSNSVIEHVGGHWRRTAFR